MSTELAMTFVLGGLLLVGVFVFATRGDWSMPTVPADASETAQAAPAAPPPAITPDAPDVPGSTWGLWGWIFLVVGVIALVVSLLLPVTVETFVPASPYDPGGSSDVINLGLLFRKGVAVACSLAAIGAGLFSIATGAVIRAIHSRAA